MEGRGRKDSDWLDLFYTYLSQFGAPDIFAKWAAIFTLGAAVQRRYWVQSKGQPVYPNLFVFLCGPPATGKGVVLGPVHDVLSRIKDHHLGTDSLTAAGLADELSDAEVYYVAPGGKPLDCNALTVVSEELGVFLPAYDNVMMNMLTKLWDNKGYSERRRKAGSRLDIPKAHLSIIAGTTPAYLNNMLPEGAWDEGFMARVMLVYSGPSGPKPITEEEELSTATTLFSQIVHDLQKICNGSGRIRWNKESLEAINTWHMAGGEPAPTHPRLHNYRGRRHFNMIKLCMLMALARRSNTIELEDFERGLDLLVETEKIMPEAFKAMKTGGDQQAMRELYDEMLRLYIKTKKPIPEWKVVTALADRVPAHNIERIIDIMVRSKLFRREDVNKVGPCYVPLTSTDA